MGYLDKLKNLKTPESSADRTDKNHSLVETKIPETPESGTLKTIKRGSDTGTPPATIRSFVDDCCTLDPTAHTRGSDLLLALADWRVAVKAPERTCSWQELAAYLEQSGCTRKLHDGSPVWHGVALKPDGPRTTPPGKAGCQTQHVGRHGRPCPQCGDTWQWPTTAGEWLCSWCFVQGRQVRAI